MKPINCMTKKTLNPVIRKASAYMLLFLAGILLPLSVVSCRHTVPDASLVFGKTVMAANVDSNNAPTALADVFSTRQNTIYVVAEARDIAPGTRLSANWLREGTVIQVSNEMTASQGYHNTNIEFHMNPGTDGWLPGNYKVQILANGQPGPSAKFTIK
jgi:hypothetical protein